MSPSVSTTQNPLASFVDAHMIALAVVLVVIIAAGMAFLLGARWAKGWFR